MVCSQPLQVHACKKTGRYADSDSDGDSDSDRECILFVSPLSFSEFFCAEVKKKKGLDTEFNKLARIKAASVPRIISNFNPSHTMHARIWTVIVSGAAVPGTKLNSPEYIIH